MHLEKSALDQQPSQKEVESFAGFWQNNRDDEMKFVKHEFTRWLSLNKCLTRLFNQWDILISYFIV